MGAIRGKLNCGGRVHGPASPLRGQHRLQNSANSTIAYSNCTISCYPLATETSRTKPYQDLGGAPKIRIKDRGVVTRRRPDRYLLRDMPKSSGSKSQPAKARDGCASPS